MLKIPKISGIRNSSFNKFNIKVENRNDESWNLYMGEYLKEPLGILSGYDQDEFEVDVDVDKNYYFYASFNVVYINFNIVSSHLNEDPPHYTVSVLNQNIIEENHEFDIPWGDNVLAPVSFVDGFDSEWKNSSPIITFGKNRTL